MFRLLLPWFGIYISNFHHRKCIFRGVFCSFRKLNDSWLDPIECVQCEYIEIVSLLFSFSCTFLFIYLSCHIHICISWSYLPTFLFLSNFIYFKKCLCLFPNYFLFSDFTSFLYSSKYLSCMFYLNKMPTSESTCSNTCVCVCTEHIRGVQDDSWKEQPEGNEL